MTLFAQQRAGGPFPEPIVPPFPGVSLFGNAAPGIDASLRVSAVWACVRLLAESVSMMPLHAYTMRDGVRTVIPDPDLLVSPAAGTTLPDWIYQAMVSLLLRGNVYGRIVGRDGRGYPTQIELLNPDLVTVTSTADGELTWRVKGTAIPAADLWHVAAFRFPGSPTGLSPITYSARTIGTMGAVETFAEGFFTEGAHPSSILTSDNPINQETAAGIKARFMAAVKGREPAVLSSGVKYQSIQVTPEESQFLATQQFGITQIARMFGVPPEMIGGSSGNSMNYANVTQRAMDFLTYSVQPWLTRLEAAIFPLLPGARHVRFDTSVLVRTDLETRVKSGAIAIASKQMTPDEVRQWSEMPPLTDEQKAWMAIIPLDASPTGMPKALPMAGAPAPAADDEGVPA